MKKISILLAAAFVGVFACATSFAQEGDLSGIRTTSLGPRSGSILIAPQNERSEPIKPENYKSFLTGFDFDFAKELIRIGYDPESLEVMSDLQKILGSRPEAMDIERIMWMVIKREGTTGQKITLLEKARVSVESRLTSELRWYFKLGQNEFQLTNAISKLDIPNLKTALSEFGELAKNAPKGTPVELVSALANLGKYGTKKTLTKTDVAVIFNTLDRYEAAMKSI
jgi:hypothetical protein